MPDFYSVQSIAEVELKIKSSRFLAKIFPVASKKEAEKKIEEIKRKHYDATHNCFAYRTGIKGEVFRYYDDKEPNNTAGRPIFSVIEGNNLTNTLIIVTRYFGSIKLGKSGLSRAYLSSAAEVLKKANFKKIISYKTISIKIPHSFVGGIYRLSENFNAEILDVKYAEKVYFDIKLEEKKLRAFIELIKDNTSGEAEIRS